MGGQVALDVHGRDELRLDCSQKGGWHLFGSIKQAAVSSWSSHVICS
jgi:hypothetical protein